MSALHLGVLVCCSCSLADVFHSAVWCPSLTLTRISLFYRPFKSLLLTHFGQCHSVCARAPLLTIPPPLPIDKMRTVCVNVFISDFLATKNALTRRRSRPTIRAENKSTIHRNSKWSCTSTCFDSSGRICALCVFVSWSRPQQTAVCRLLSRFSFTNPPFTWLMWIRLVNTDC